MHQRSIYRDTVYPCAYHRTAFELIQALPDVQQYFLVEVIPAIGIPFICTAYTKDPVFVIGQNFFKM
jgi:hypothetical protein